MSSPQHKLWDLKQEAKWSSDPETQKRAIQELGKLGEPALSALEEVVAVSSRDEIREYCRGVILGVSSLKIGETEKNQPEDKSEVRSVSQEKRS